MDVIRTDFDTFAVITHAVDDGVNPELSVTYTDIYDFNPGDRWANVDRRFWQHRWPEFPRWGWYGLRE